MMGKWVKALLALIITTLLGNCSSESTNSGLKALMLNLEQGNNEADISLLEQQYDRHAEWYPPNNSIVKGWSEIKSRYQSGFAEFDISIAFTLSDVSCLGKIAYITGETTGYRISKHAKDTLIIQDKFMLKARYQGKWKLERLIWNETR